MWQARFISVWGWSRHFLAAAKNNRLFRGGFHRAIYYRGEIMNIGVIGAGRIGKVHAENLVLRIQETNVVAIADVIVASAQETAQRLNIPKATADYHELLNSPDIEAVVICSATDTHTQIII